MSQEVKSYKLKALPTRPIPDAILYIKADGDASVSTYITDINGIPYPLKDTGGSGGSSIKTIVNTDGTISVLGTDNTVLNLSTAIKNIINSALQSGDNISELLNDAGYITIADVPSQVVNLQATSSPTDVVINNTNGTNATILAATATDAGVLLPNDKTKLNNLSGVNSGDQNSIVGISGTKTEYNTSLTDGDFLFVGDVSVYTNEEAQDAVGSILLDTPTIDLNYDDSTPSLSASVKPNSITSTELADNINLTEFVNNAGFENTAQLNIRDTNNRNRANHTGTQAISTVANLQSSLDAKEDVANKTQDIETNKTSTTLYSSVKQLYDWATAKFQAILVSGTNIKTVNFGNLLGIGNLPIQFMNAATFEAYGDSITVGQNSSPTSNSYVNLTAGLYAKTVTNRAVSGRGIWEATRLHFANVATSSTVLSIVMAGFNDVRRGGSAIKTRNKIINGYKSILANQFLSSFLPANPANASIVKSGTWSLFSGLAVGAKTNTGSFSSISGNYIEYTFTDNNVVVGLVGADGVTQIYADFTVLIDGVSQGTFTENNQTDGISDGVNDNSRSAMNLIFSGLSEGTHVIRLTNTTNLPLVIDYFGHMKMPKFCYPVLIMQAPKMDATGYATVPNLANDTVINQLNADILSLVATFPADYPIVVGDTNTYYNVATGLDTADHIHPNNIGHRQIYRAAYTALKPLLLGGSTTTVVDATTTVKGIVKLANDLGGTADLPTVPGLLLKLNVNANASLAGTGTRMMEAIADGTPIATYVKYQMKVSDSDVITAITGATYTGGIATITPTSSKVMYEGQVYQASTYLYRAYSDNVVLRTAIV